jgi:phytoene synthase
MLDKTFYSIFQQGSRTYFYSSLFFPTDVRKQVFILYGFVRKADNFVDCIPQNRKGFYEFKNRYHLAKQGKKTGDIVIDSFVALAKKNEFQEKWVDAFLHSMELDLMKHSYVTAKETLEYVYGSAEVIGLMMAKLMELQPESFEYAKYLGRAMQYINFIRDIAEDLRYGRTYFPMEDLEKHNLTNLTYEHTKNNPRGFSKFIDEQIKKYYDWQMFAEQGYKYIPRRYLISVKTASEMYKWTARQIQSDPFVVYEWKVKPLISKILITTVSNLIDTMGHKYESGTRTLKRSLL